MRSSDAAPLSRRAFVRSLGVAGAALAAAPWLAGRSATVPHGERSLVVIHLAGGHDGLSTFVPCDDDGYHRARPTLALQRRDTVQLGEAVWLNRAAADLAEIWERGQLAVVPETGFGVSVPSHFRATELWLTGSASDEVAGSRWTDCCGRRGHDDAGDFERALTRVAERIASSEAGEIHRVRLGGFDTHFDQRAAHDAAIATFARGVAQFQRRLARSGVADRVLTLAFSEFGRALEENEFGGTHHGERGQCYFIGAPVRGGAHGAIVATTAAGAMPIDYRRAIATAAAGWLRAAPRRASGEAIAPLPVLLGLA
ncbi:MAG: DUF1501 domain-containing protein [Opitutae bacterium]|nr:DUF1501 domain-containing protein [Opitutae bacterium]